ncbi:hypothetical protein HO133_007121 [Letharia lupina]|uniref:Tetratricopeptide repeat protein 1 n=1 Tax=Letharia lupina TaxID=560253 RepID=A0A8H6KYE5_9LECA|nr:uncharacterized protein HO133_007121 [Letharia lupina]KAF6229007.1 hypothetical protein HO133_007121 [Letharia lupina]
MALPDPSPDLPDESEASLVPRFSQEEEAALLQESNAQKSTANKFFTSSQYSQAIGEYDKALSSCPNYLEYEIAVLKSNIAACHLKLEDWKAAVESATTALDALDRLLPKKKENKEDDAEKDGGVVEIEGEGAEAEEELKKLEMSDQRRDDILRIRSKALMRRAKANSEQGGWGNLQGAEDDYKALAQLPTLPPQDQKIVQAALRSLPPRINTAKEREMGDMMGKLKELGNGILKPFGLSTDNFKMDKDPNTGSYSMNFNQGR